MKKCFTLISAAFVFAILSTPVMAENSSVELGKKLFNEPGLGASKNDKNCNTCHNNGKGLENAGGNPKLTEIINKCITGPLEGEKIDGRTVAMRS
ncbi:cytochrome C, partial [bacterium]|nr:cytochrome C [bacterium]